jgi:hypothetical protein
LSDKGLLKTYESLESLYRSVTDRFQTVREKQRILELLCDNFNAMTPSEPAAEKMLGFGKVLADLIQSPRTPDSLRRAAEGHLHFFSVACGQKLAASLKFHKHMLSMDDAILFCIKNNIPAADIMPSIDTLAEELGSDNINVQMKAAEFLDAFGGKAAPAQGKVLKTLRRAERNTQSGSTNLRWSLIAVLGNIKTKTPEALDLLIEALSDNDYKIPDYAMQSLAKIGKPAIIPLRAAFDSSEDFIKIRIVKTFALMGKEASAEIAFMKTRLGAAKNPAVRDEIEDALEKIEKTSK